MDERGGSLGDVDDHVAHAFEVAVDFNSSGEEAEILRHGLMQRGEPDRDLVDLDIELVDAVFHPPDFLGGRLPAFDKPEEAGGDGRFDKTAHLQEARLEVCEFSDEGARLQGNSKIALFAARGQ